MSSPPKGTTGDEGKLPEKKLYGMAVDEVVTLMN